MKATFTFDDDAAQWWIDRGGDQGDHEPENGKFVADVSSLHFVEMTGAYARFLELRDRLVASAGLEPDGPVKSVICPTFTLAADLVADHPDNALLQEAIEACRRFARCTTCGHCRDAHEMAAESAGR